MSLGDYDIVKPSQALISNREQIYVTYPELAGPKAFKVTGTRVHKKKLSIMAEEEVQDIRPTQLSLALQPQY